MFCRLFSRYKPSRGMSGGVPASPKVCAVSPAPLRANTMGSYPLGARGLGGLRLRRKLVEIRLQLLRRPPTRSGSWGMLTRQANCSWNNSPVGSEWVYRGSAWECGSATIYFLFMLQYHSEASNHDQSVIVSDTVQPPPHTNRSAQTAYAPAS